MIALSGLRSPSLARSSPKRTTASDRYLPMRGCGYVWRMVRWSLAVPDSSVANEWLPSGRSIGVRVVPQLPRQSRFILSSVPRRTCEAEQVA